MALHNAIDAIVSRLRGTRLDYFSVSDVLLKREAAATLAARNAADSAYGILRTANPPLAANDCVPLGYLTGGGGSRPPGWVSAASATWTQYQIGTLTSDTTNTDGSGVVSVYGPCDAATLLRGLETPCTFADGATVGVMLDGESGNVSQDVVCWLRSTTGGGSVVWGWRSAGAVSHWYSPGGPRFDDGPYTWPGLGPRQLVWRRSGTSFIIETGSPYGGPRSPVDFSAIWTRDIVTLCGAVPDRLGFGLLLSAAPATGFRYRASVASTLGL